MTILDKIFAAKREVASSRTVQELAEAKARALDASPVRGFLSALTGSGHDPALIAEVKKGSPSAGTIRADFDPVSLARTYESVGADCLSVLTDEEFFQGSLGYLTEAREATGLPVLRKDFTVCEHDIYEARAAGADAVLLIVSGLGRGELEEFLGLAKSLGMDALVEAHTLEEAETALEIGSTLVGVNNRDLETFEVRIETSESVIPELVGRAVLVSESALRTHGDIERVRAAGARAVLIGTAFCEVPDVAGQVRKVMGW